MGHGVFVTLYGAWVMGKKLLKVLGPARAGDDITLLNCIYFTLSKKNSVEIVLFL